MAVYEQRDSIYLAALAEPDCLYPIIEDVLRRHLREYGADPGEALRALLDGVRGPYRDIVVLNASAALRIVDPAQSFSDARARAEESIDSGAALSVLHRLAGFSHG